MPLVKVYLPQGKDAAFRQAVGDAIHQALVAEANVPPDDRFQLFVGLAPDEVNFHSTYGGVERSSELIIIEITLNSGRSVEVKCRLYAAIAAELERAAAIRKDDVLISLVEVTKENWSFGGGRATYA